MPKTAASGANGRTRTSNTNGTFNSFTSNNSRGSGPMNEDPNTNNEVNQRTPRPTKSFSPPTGMRLGNSQVTSYNTAVNQNAATRKSAGNAAISRQRQQQSKSRSSSYQTAKSERTMQRNLTTSAAEARRGNIVPQNVLNSYMENKKAMGRDLQRNIGIEIEKGLMNRQITREKFLKLQGLLNKGKRILAEKLRQKAAAEAKRKAAAAAANAQKRANEKARAMKQKQENNKAAAAKAAAKAAANAAAKAAANAAAKAAANKAAAKAKRQKVAKTPVPQFRTAAQGAAAVLKNILENKKQAALMKLNRHSVPEQNKVELRKTITNASTSNKVNAVTTLINKNFPIKNKDNLSQTSTNTPTRTTLLNNIDKLKATSLRKRAQELGFRRTMRELETEYSGKPGISRLREELKTFVTKTPAKRKRGATPVLGNNRQSEMLVTKGLLEVYMDKIAMGKRKLFTIEKQKEVLDYIVNRNLSGGHIRVERTISPKTFINMLLIMWLDGVHDKYITMTFKHWLSAYKDVFDPENYVRDPYFQELQRASFVELNQNKNSVRKLYILDGKKILDILNGAISATIRIELAETPGKRIFFAETFINNLGFKGQTFTSFSAGWEKNFKTIVLQKYIGLGKVNTIINPRDYNIKSRTGADRILLAVDQEYSGREERSLSGMISGSDSVSPLITYGQAFDPGSTMLPFGIVKDIEKIAIVTRTKKGLEKEIEPRFVSDASYYLEDFNITIKSNTAVIKIEFDSGKKTGKSNLKLNDIPLKLNVSAGNAKKNESVVEKIGKYFGDALQYFIASQLTKASERDRIKKIRNGESRTYHYFLGSGDGMALFGYDFVCTEIFRNGAPNMVIDYSEGSVPIAHIINMDNTKFVLPEKEPVPSRSNVIMGSYRTRENNIGPNNGAEVTGPSRT